MMEEKEEREEKRKRADGVQKKEKSTFLVFPLLYLPTSPNNNWTFMSVSLGQTVHLYTCLIYSLMFIVHMRLGEINRKLLTGDVVPPEKERSPSPEPFYGPDGKRVNTREFRYKKKLEDEKIKLIEDTMKKYPDFKPPADYRRQTKLTGKVYIPAKEFPEINFIGLLIGPRGNTLKKMESETGSKISIRGKGSVKEGKSRSDGQPQPGQDEDLHCLITADSDEKIAKAIKIINEIIDTVSSCCFQGNDDANGARSRPVCQKDRTS
jgi:hypothetical protein